MNKTRKLGLFTLTSLVAGNMIGSGIFILPADLARVGSISLLSWCFTAIGAFLLALVFSKMSRLVPKGGGPYAYAQAGFGDFVGFQTAYSYWIAVWVGNSGVVVALVGYLRVFFPQLADPIWGTVAALIIVWIFTGVNIAGVRTAGMVQLTATILKFIPILVVAILGWGYFHPEYLTHSFNITGRSNFSAFSYASTLTLWAFIGVESATVPVDSVENPRRNIPLATLFGTAIAAALYIASSTAVMGMVPADVLVNSTSPFAAAAKVIFGQWGEWIIAGGAVISCLGGLNGWILVQGQVAMAAAEDNMLPKLLAKRNNIGAPVWALIITSTLMSLLLLLTSDPNLVSQFQFIILIATTTSLTAYLFTAVAEIVLLVRHGEHGVKKQASIIIALLAAIYSFWALFGSEKDIIYYVMMMIFAGVILYSLVVWGRKKRSEILG